MTRSAPWKDLRRSALWNSPSLVCLAINSIIFTGIAISTPGYLTDYTLNKNPDAPPLCLAREEHAAARTILAARALHTRRTCSGRRFIPYLQRRSTCAAAQAIYAVQVLLQIGCCVLVYMVAARYFSRLTAVFASLWVATDVVWATSNFEAMSEPLFVFLMILSVERLARALSWTQPGMSRTSTLCQSGLVLGAAILTRPVALYVLIVYLLVLLVSGWTSVRRNGGGRRPDDRDPSLPGGLGSPEHGVFLAP